MTERISHRVVSDSIHDKACFSATAYMPYSALHNALPCVMHHIFGPNFEEKKPFILFFNFFKDFIYLFLDRGEAWERGRETSMCGCLLNTPHQGPGPQPTCV